MTTLACVSAPSAGLRPKPNTVVLVALLVFANTIVLYNSLIHDPAVGYDMEAHIPYLEIVAQGRLPRGIDESRTFFSAPGPYAIPALARAAGLSLPLAVKLAQLANVIFSLLTFLYVIRIAHLIDASDRTATLAVFLLASLPVYYHMHAQLRGEPIVTTLATMIAFHLCEIFLIRFSWPRVLRLGGLLGGIILARQWGFFVYPPMVGFLLLLLWQRRQTLSRLIKAGTTSWSTAFIVGGWFYVRQIVRFGTPIPFDRPTSPASLGARIAGRFLTLRLRTLFTAPRMYAFGDCFWPTFYTSVWGDYWGIFNLMSPKDALFKALYGPAYSRSYATPASAMVPYYARVNLVSLLPSTVFVAGVVHGAWSLVRVITRRENAADPRDLVISLCWLITVCSFGCFMLFSLAYETGGTHMKAGYMLHIYPTAAILAADLLRRIMNHWQKTGSTLLIALVAVWLHNFLMIITGYSRPWLTL